MTSRHLFCGRHAAFLGTAVLTSLSVAAGVAAAGPGGDLSKPGAATRLDGDQTKTVRRAIDGSKARNVILLIGDGMGDSEITSARKPRRRPVRRRPPPGARRTRRTRTTPRRSRR